MDRTTKFLGEELIMMSVNGLGKKVFGLCSGGKDSMAACAVAHSYRPLDGILYVDTGIAAEDENGIKPAKEASKNFAEKLGVPFYAEYTPFDYEWYVKRFGFPHPSQHSMTFIYLKWKAMNAFAKRQKNEKGKRIPIVFISGVRTQESHKRAGSAKPVSIDPADKHMRFVAPIIHWTTEDCIKYSRKHGFVLSTCYKTIMMSGDCLCGAYAQEGETALIKKFYPKVAKKICALEEVAYKGHKGKIKHYGNHMSMKDTMLQKEMEDYICADCNIHRRNE